MSLTPQEREELGDLAEKLALMLKPEHDPAWGANVFYVNRTTASLLAKALDELARLQREVETMRVR